MTEVLKKAKVPIIAIIFLIIGFFVYNFFIKKDEEVGGISKPGMVNGEKVAKSPSENFLPLLNLIRNVNFDDTFFNDSVFRSLVDFSESIKEEQKGRVNPFDPSIGASAFLSNSDVTFVGSEVSNVNPATSQVPVLKNATTTPDKTKIK